MNRGHGLANALRLLGATVAGTVYLLGITAQNGVLSVGLG